MARTTGIGIQLKGKVGNVVFVPYDDETIVRIAPARRRPDQWSKKQQEQRQRFGGVNSFYRSMKKEFVEPIWKLSATPKLTGYNLFMKANLPAFGQKALLADESLLHFSCGPIALPQRLLAERLPEQFTEVMVSWDPYCSTSQERPDDELCFVVTDDPNTARLVASGVSRSAGSYHLQLTPQQALGNPLLWLFFRRKDASAWSDDKFFRL